MMYQVAVLALALQVLAAWGAEIDCSDFSVDQCKSGSAENPQVEVLHNTDVNNCAFFCNTIYADQCKAVREGGCMFESNLLDHLNNVADEKTCQMACQHIHGCEFFVWDKFTKDCEILDGSARQCDLIRIPKGEEIASYDFAKNECKDGPAPNPTVA